MTGFIRNKSAMLTEWIENDKVIRFLEFDDRVPLLIGNDLLHSFLNVATVKPEV